MKALVIVAEGMDPYVLEQEVGKGNLPWFAEQLKRNNYRHLNCGPVPYEPSNLATAFSGVNPGKHGCFSYWSTHAAGEMPRVLDANDVKAKRVWEWPELKGYKFNVVNVQLTHPPTSINGKMISYLMQNSLNASYPRNLISELLKNDVKYAHDVSLFYKGQPFSEFACEAWRIAEYQLQSAMAMAEDTDVLIVNLTLVDRLSHFLWYELKQEDLGRRPHVLAAYDFIDSACRQLASLDPEMTLVFSEMGFGELREFVSINEHLQEAGLLVTNAQGEIDLTKSVAMEAVQGSHGVMLCRDLFNTGKASQAETEEVMQCLREIRFDNSKPILKEVAHRREVYHGQYTHLAPSIIITPHDERYPPLGDPRWANHVRRGDQSAWHREKGFVVLDGPSGIDDASAEVQLEQIAPTIARALGCEASQQCESNSLIAG
ncbi:Type I phosphodiesterase/nucleotide pyrophosphatase [Vibrio crassostreae]|nr:Type I phosphodiesterase/nucleotide pyrophosphatase [Vibrio crassostreae]CAK2773235.1 Type I phosphodiesterase/nucleotide pyrophosphatase [Vibrio crassostreae]CAK3219064.1 Type I phosphodiesterase/nucleotide pyrophosphatase [Vibrio crassostreae]CAK3840872.1 Type I phosphodiesterase/nucleotide pyrophosphatase [Vibrio crassostreae]